MTDSINRRQFLVYGAAGAAGLMLPAQPVAAASPMTAYGGIGFHQRDGKRQSVPACQLQGIGGGVGGGGL